jgi:AcrR family transcriptional regulator
LLLAGLPSPLNMRGCASLSGRWRNAVWLVYTVYMIAHTTAWRIAAAARRLLDKEGTEGVSIRGVARAVGITPMAIYRHYPDRASLLNALADEGFEALAARLGSKKLSGSIEERLTRMMEIYLEQALQNPRLFELMFLKPREGARTFPRDFKAGRSPTANLLVEVVQIGMHSGYFRKGDAWEIVFEMGALSHGLILLYLGGRMAVPPAQFRAFYRRCFRRFIRGIRKG